MKTNDTMQLGVTPAMLRAAATGAISIGMLAIAGCEDEPETLPAETDADAVIIEREVDATAAYDAESEAEPELRTGEAVMVNTAWNVERDEENGDEMVVLQVPAPDGTDGLVIRRSQPGEVRVGEPLQYTIEVENVGQIPMHDIVLKEWRTGGLQIAQGQRQNGQTQTEHAGNQSQWSIMRLAPGQSRTFDVQGVVEEEGRITSCMTVAYEPTVCFATDVVQPELRVRRAVERETAYVCDEIEVVYLVENLGSGTAKASQLVEQLPEGVMTADGQPRVVLDIEPLEAGQQVEKRILLRGERPGEYSSFAALTSGEIRARSRATPYRFVRPQLDLRVDAPAQEYVGRDVPVRIQLTNNSSWPAVETRLVIPGVDEMSQVSVSTQNVEMAEGAILVGRIDPGETRTMTLVFAADEVMTHEIEVAANAYCAEAVAQSVNVNVLGVEAVRLETIDLVDPVTVGQETVYEVRVKNQGSADSINVNVNAMLPDQMTFVGGQGDSPVRGEGQRIDLAPIDRLAPGDVATWRIRAMADEPGKTRLRLELTSDATRRAVIEQEPTTIVSRPAIPQD